MAGVGDEEAMVMGVAMVELRPGQRAGVTGGEAEVVVGATAYS